MSVQEPNALRSFAFAGLGEENWIGVRGPLSVGGIDRGFTVRVGVAEASLQLGGVTLTSHRELYPVTIGSDGETLHASAIVVPQSVLEVDRLPARQSGQREMPTLFLADAIAVQPHAPSAGQYRGRVRVVLQRHEIEAMLPLSRGHVHHRGSYRLAIDGVDWRLGSASVQVHESRAGSPFERELHPSYSYFLRNRRQREAVQGFGRPLGEAMSSFGNFSFAFGGDHRQDGFMARELLLQFSAGNRDEEAIVIDEAWLAEAELVIVATRRAGMVERDLAIANFPITLPTRAGF